MTITNLTEAKVTQTGETFDYGKIKKGSNSLFQIIIEEDSPIDFKRTKACGCMTLKCVTEDGKVKCDVSYNSNLVGDFNKPVEIFYLYGDTEKKTTIKVKGTVK